MNTLQKLRTMILMVLLASVIASTTKAQAVGNEFSIDNLKYKIIKLTPAEVKVILNDPKPTGNISIPSTVQYKGQDYSVTSIGDYAFNKCSSITSVSIPNSVINIGYWAFSYCRSLKAIAISNYVTSIGDYAFEACHSLTSIYVDENNPKYSSENGVLFNKDKTVLIQYPLGKTATTYNVPNTITRIGIIAFSNSRYLTMVSLPNTIKSIGEYAFSLCSLLTIISSKIENPSKLTMEYGVFDGTDTDKCKLYIPKGTLDKYKEAEQWKEFFFIIDEKVTSVMLNKTTKELTGNETIQLIATVEPSNATHKTIIWSSSKPGIATVDENGLVIPKAEGISTITATTYDGGFTATCDITVKAVKVTSIKIGTTTKELKVNETFTITANVEPSNATNQNITWKSSKDDIATVDEKSGLVTAKGVGVATITAATEDGEFSATCEVTVKPATGLNDNSVNNIVIYPTLVNSGFTVEVPKFEDFLGKGGISEIWLSIYTQTGKRVKNIKLTNEKQFVDVNGLASGVYIAKVGGKVIEFVKK